MYEEILSAIDLQVTRGIVVLYCSIFSNNFIDIAKKYVEREQQISQISVHSRSNDKSEDINTNNADFRESNSNVSNKSENKIDNCNADTTEILRLIKIAILISRNKIKA